MNINSFHMIKLTEVALCIELNIVLNKERNKFSYFMVM